MFFHGSMKNVRHGCHGLKPEMFERLIFSRNYKLWILYQILDKAGFLLLPSTNHLYFYDVEKRKSCDHQIGSPLYKDWICQPVYCINAKDRYVFIIFRKSSKLSDIISFQFLWPFVYALWKNRQKKITNNGVDLSVY